MRNIRNLVTMMFVGMMMAAGLPAAKADAANWKTYMTFSAPVEIPGMVLGPGKYVFKLLDSLMPGEVVAVYNSDGRIMEAVQGIPDYRLKATDKSVVTLEERATGSPKAIQSWFYPGNNYGIDFIYPKAKTTQRAKTK